MKPMMVYMPGTLHEELERKSKEMLISKSAICRIALQEYCKEEVVSNDWTPYPFHWFYDRKRREYLQGVGV